LALCAATGGFLDFFFFESNFLLVPIAVRADADAEGVAGAPTRRPYEAEEESEERRYEEEGNPGDPADPARTRKVGSSSDRRVGAAGGEEPVAAEEPVTFWPEDWPEEGRPETEDEKTEERPGAPEVNDGEPGESRGPHADGSPPDPADPASVGSSDSSGADSSSAAGGSSAEEPPAGQAVTFWPEDWEAEDGEAEEGRAQGRARATEVNGGPPEPEEHVVKPQPERIMDAQQSPEKNRGEVLRNDEPPLEEDVAPVKIPENAPLEVVSTPDVLIEDQHSEALPEEEKEVPVVEEEELPVAEEEAPVSVEDEVVEPVTDEKRVSESDESVQAAGRTQQENVDERATVAHTDAEQAAEVSVQAPTAYSDDYVAQAVQAASEAVQDGKAEAPEARQGTPRDGPAENRIASSQGDDAGEEPAVVVSDALDRAAHVDVALSDEGASVVTDARPETTAGVPYEDPAETRGPQKVGGEGVPNSEEQSESGEERQQENAGEERLAENSSVDPEAVVSGNGEGQLGDEALETKENEGRQKNGPATSKQAPDAGAEEEALKLREKPGSPEKAAQRKLSEEEDGAADAFPESVPATLLHEENQVGGASGDWGADAPSGEPTMEALTGGVLRYLSATNGTTNEAGSNGTHVSISNASTSSNNTVAAPVASSPDSVNVLHPGDVLPSTLFPVPPPATDANGTVILPLDAATVCTAAAYNDHLLALSTRVNSSSGSGVSNGTQSSNVAFQIRVPYVDTVSEMSFCDASGPLPGPAKRFLITHLRRPQREVLLYPDLQTEFALTCAGTYGCSANVDAFLVRSPGGSCISSTNTSNETATARGARFLLRGSGARFHNISRVSYTMDARGLHGSYEVCVAPHSSGSNLHSSSNDNSEQAGGFHTGIRVFVFPAFSWEYLGRAAQPVTLHSPELASPTNVSSSTTNNTNSTATMPSQQVARLVLKSSCPDSVEFYLGEGTDRPNAALDGSVSVATAGACGRPVPNTNATFTSVFHAASAQYRLTGFLNLANLEKKKFYTLCSHGHGDANLLRVWATDTFVKAAAGSPLPGTSLVTLPFATSAADSVTGLMLKNEFESADVFLAPNASCVVARNSENNNFGNPPLSLPELFLHQNNANDNSELAPHPQQQNQRKAALKTQALDHDLEQKFQKIRVHCTHCFADTSSIFLSREEGSRCDFASRGVDLDEAVLQLDDDTAAGAQNQSAGFQTDFVTQIDVSKLNATSHYAVCILYQGRGTAAAKFSHGGGVLVASAPAFLLARIFVNPVRNVIPAAYAHFGTLTVLQLRGFWRAPLVLENILADDGLGNVTKSFSSTGNRTSLDFGIFGTSSQLPLAFALAEDCAFANSEDFVPLEKSLGNPLRNNETEYVVAVKPTGRHLCVANTDAGSFRAPGYSGISLENGVLKAMPEVFVQKLAVCEKTNHLTISSAGSPAPVSQQEGSTNSQVLLTSANDEYYGAYIGTDAVVSGFDGGVIIGVTDQAYRILENVNVSSRAHLQKNRVGPFKCHAQCADLKSGTRRAFLSSHAPQYANSELSAECVFNKRFCPSVCATPEGQTDAHGYALRTAAVPLEFDDFDSFWLPNLIFENLRPSKYYDVCVLFENQAVGSEKIYTPSGLLANQNLDYAGSCLENDFHLDDIIGADSQSTRRRVCTDANVTTSTETCVNVTNAHVASVTNVTSGLITNTTVFTNATECHSVNTTVFHY